MPLFFKVMFNQCIKKLFYSSLFVSAAFGNISAQTQSENVKPVNFRYSQNPKIKTKTTDPTAQSGGTNSGVPQTEKFEGRSAAAKTLAIAKRTVAASSPTETYKIDTGDVLLISLQNIPGKTTNYFTVLSDGTIDYPLAGEMVSVQGLTTDEVEDLLKDKIKLYENLQPVVRVREFASHRYTVLGLVEKAGEKSLQREAVPLYVVRAEAVTQAQAAVAVIKRANSETEKIVLSQPKADEILIFPGDIVEFKAADMETVNKQVPQFYYIGGSVNVGGQKEFFQGITLTQAVLASGGLKKTGVRRIIIRRKNQEGLLASLEFDLNSIKNGNQPDPVLQAGDTVEIGY